MKFKYIIYKISFSLSQERSFFSVSKVNLFPKEIIRNYREKPTKTIHALPEENSDIFIKEGGIYEGWNFNSGNYLFTTDTK